MPARRPYFGDRILSGHEMPRSKPAPDVYLAAAARLRAEPAACLVVEDTVTGVRAGMAAGCTVWAYAPEGADARPLVEAGALQVLGQMADLAERLGR